MPTFHITIKMPVLIDTPACNKQNAHQDSIEPSRGISSCQIICPAPENSNKTQSHTVDGVLFVSEYVYNSTNNKSCFFTTTTTTTTTTTPMNNWAPFFRSPHFFGGAKCMWFCVTDTARWIWRNLGGTSSQPMNFRDVICSMQGQWEDYAIFCTKIAVTLDGRDGRFPEELKCLMMQM